MRIKIYRCEWEWEHQYTHMHIPYICINTDVYTCIHICKYICSYVKSYIYRWGNKIMQAYKINSLGQSAVHLLLNLHNSQELHLQTGPEHSFNLHLNSDTCSIFLIDVGSSFQILRPWYRNDFKPFRILFTFGCHNLIPPHVLYGVAEMQNISVILLGLHLCSSMNTPNNFTQGVGLTICPDMFSSISLTSLAFLTTKVWTFLGLLSSNHCQTSSK